MLKKLTYICKNADAGKTVKSIIARDFSLSSRTLSRLKKSGGILVNGQNVTVRFVMSQGDTLTLCLFDEQSESIEKVYIPLDILYEDEDILAVNKPYGMPTHPSQGHHNDTLANAVMYYFGEGDHTFRAISRLDGDTTGVVLIAKNALSAQRLTDMMQKGQICKTYTALCMGSPLQKSGVIDAPVSRCENSVIKRKIDFEFGKNAVTEYDVERTLAKGMSVISAHPITGRTHQIRLHLSHIGHPIYGDFLYGEPIDGTRAYLHCRALEFIHPMTGKSIKIEAQMPSDMKQLIALFDVEGRADK